MDLTLYIVIVDGAAESAELFATREKAESYARNARRMTGLSSIILERNVFLKDTTLINLAEKIEK